MTKPFDSSHEMAPCEGKKMKKTLVFRNVHQGAALLEGEALKALAAECAEAVAVCEAG